MFLSKISGFLITYAEWAAEGFPLREPDWVREIFDEHCNPCPHYDPLGRTELGSKGLCRVCGCHVSPRVELLNKISLPNTSCPLTPPKWQATVEGDPNDNPTQKEP